MAPKNPARIITEDCSPALHLAAARRTPPPNARSWEIEPSMQFALEKLKRLGPEVHRFRSIVLQEIEDMAESLADLSSRWKSSLLPEIRAGYGDAIVNAPLFASLLRDIDYPDAAPLFKELTAGFQLIGPVAQGVGWPDKPALAAPCPMAEFLNKNETYVKRRLAARKPADHHDTMLAELLNDTKLGRVVGPFSLPDKWKCLAPNQPIAGVRLLTKPSDAECSAAAFAFAVEQLSSDGLPKVRRAEGWRASGHNATTSTSDSPRHHTIDHYISLAAAARELGLDDLQVWGHDHEGAYRMFPAGPPDVMWVILEGPDGVSLWRHRVMIFGSKAAVWCYGRVGDALTHLLRILLAIPGLHYVDDYGGIEPGSHAGSAFDSFEHFGKLIGLKVKQSKKQPPAASHQIQGVIFVLEGDHAIVQPTPNRRARLLSAIREAICDDLLIPVRAETLAGKLNFYASAVFGSLGSAALRSIYQRAHNADAACVFGKTAALTPGLRAALTSIEDLLKSARPKRISLRAAQTQHACLYADAFFVDAAGARRNLAELESIDHAALTADGVSNGWGIAVVLGDRVWLARGSVPISLFGSLKKKKTYIFYLEALAQCLVAWLFEPELGSSYWAFVDNTSAEFALRKGYSRDGDANRLTAFFWASVAAAGAAPWFERVASAAQVADGPSRGDMSWLFRGTASVIDFDLDEIYSLLAEKAAIVPARSAITQLRQAVARARTKAGLRRPLRR